MRPSLWTGLVLLGLACAPVDSTGGPSEPPAGDGDATYGRSDNGPGVLIEVNTRKRSLSTVRMETTRTTRAGGPSLSLLDGEAIGVELSNYTVSPVGAYAPDLVRVRFEVRIDNRFTGVELVPPDLAPAVPAPGVLMLIPFLQQAEAGATPVYTGSDASIVIDQARTVLVRPSDDWGGGGALGNVGYDFSRGTTCAPAAPGCSRWEGFAPLAPGATSTVQTVGFDVAAAVGSFRVRLLLSANLKPVDGAGAPPPVVVPPAFAGIPYGPFHLPAAQLGDPYSGLLRTVIPGQLNVVLDSVNTRGGRIVLAVSRRASSNADETFNLTYWKWEVDRYRAANLDPYLQSGTIAGMYIVDEPDCAECWGGVTIPQATVDEMAAYVKAIWPELVTMARVVPGWFDPYGPPRHLDAAWAQYEGPLHIPSAGQTPREFRDVQIADANRLGLGLVLGANVLDGGDGSSGIPGTVAHYTRFQMSPAEYERADSVFAATPYVCAVLDWRYSIDYPEPGVDAGVLQLIRDFHQQPDVIAASARIAAVARDRAAAPCRRR